MLSIIQIIEQARSDIQCMLLYHHDDAHKHSLWRLLSVQAILLSLFVDLGIDEPMEAPNTPDFMQVVAVDHANRQRLQAGNAQQNAVHDQFRLIWVEWSSRLRLV